jgi:hypothetical protein
VVCLFRRIPQGLAWGSFESRYVGPRYSAQPRQRSHRHEASPKIAPSAHNRNRAGCTALAAPWTTNQSLQDPLCVCKLLQTTPSARLQRAMWGHVGLFTILVGCRRLFSRLPSSLCPDCRDAYTACWKRDERCQVSIDCQRLTLRLPRYVRGTRCPT